MSRAFVTDKEDWVYCAKAGERCMHAEAGDVKASSEEKPEPRRETKKSTLKKPQKWGGRSGS